MICRQHQKQKPDIKIEPEITDHRGKCLCMADFLFDWFRLDQASKTVDHLT